MEKHEIGEYSVKGGEEVLDLYMLQLPQRISAEFGGPVIPPTVVYCMERWNGPAHMFIEDWLAFAHLVNRMAGEEVLDIHEDAAVNEGICVPVGMECPDCGCRMVDWLVWTPDESELFCEHCKATYTPGEQ